MLYKIRIRNIGAIYDEQILDFSCARYSFKSDMIWNEKIVNPIAIYGQNGSGKTIVVKAFKHLASYFYESSDNLAGFLPNIYHGVKETSEIELFFSLNGYDYSYEIISEISGEINFEVLKLLGSNEKSIFERSREKIMVLNEYVDEVEIGPNFPYLRLFSNERSDSNEFEVEHIKRVYKYLSQISYIDVHGIVHSKKTNQVSINDILVEQSDSVKEILKGYKEFPVYDIVSKIDKITGKKTYNFKMEGQKLQLPMDYMMSSGMKSHSILLSTILGLDKGSLLVVDELERNIHPIVLDLFIKLIGRLGIQLIFTSHNTHLLQSLRPDQIFFSHWKEGYSYYERLSNIYPNIREVNNIEKMYLGGVFGEA